MSATDLQIHGPKEQLDLGRLEANRVNLEKSDAPNIRGNFAQAAMMPGQAPQSLFDMSMPSKEDLAARAECSGVFLQELKMGPQKDSFLGVACNEISKDVREIGNALTPEQTMMDPRQMQLQAQFSMMPKPASFF